MLIAYCNSGISNNVCTPQAQSIQGVSQTSPLRSSRTAIPFHRMPLHFHDLFFLRGKKSNLTPKLILKIFEFIFHFTSISIYIPP